MYYQDYYSQNFFQNDVNMRLAQAYVVVQKYISIYPPEEALKRGTVFPELDLPYKVEK
jgi:hypothetical protein